MPTLRLADYLQEDLVLWDLPRLDKTHLVVGRTRESLDFAALDSEPVDLLFLLLSPPEAQVQHLRLLARLARIFVREPLLERLRTAAGPEELLAMLLEEDARHVV